MRYQLTVTDHVHSAALTELSAAEARLAGALARPRLIAAVCVAALSGLGWLALAAMAIGSGDWGALCRPAAAGGLIEVTLVPPMWAAMVLAMMLPTAGPMILTYAEIADTAARKREPVVSPLILIAGYVAVWLGFALAASVAQIALARFTLIEAGRAGALLSGALFIAAGFYQFSALKRACLAHCQRPFPFFFANWTTQPRGVFRLGLRQGLYCLGCCWALMLIMFAAGVMNVIWMAALGVVMTIEKMSTTARFSHVVGAVMIAIGAGLITVSVV